MCKKIYNYVEGGTSLDIFLIDEIQFLFKILDTDRAYYNYLNSMPGDLYEKYIINFL